MFDKVLLIIAFVPLKSRAAKEDFVGIIHSVCILLLYTERKADTLGSFPLCFSQRLQTRTNRGDLDQFRQTMAQAQTVQEPEQREERDSRREDKATASAREELFSSVSSVTSVKVSSSTAQQRGKRAYIRKVPHAREPPPVRINLAHRAEAQVPPAAGEDVHVPVRPAGIERKFPTLLVEQFLRGVGAGAWPRGPVSLQKARLPDEPQLHA